MTTSNAERPVSASRRFGRHALVYFVSYVVVRGLTFLLTPLYTRAMSPGDYAVLAVANTLTTVLSILVGAGLYGAIPRLLHDYPGDSDRRRFLGTVLAFSGLFSVAFALLLNVAGVFGQLDWFDTVRFRPHLQLVIWTAVFTNLTTLPTTVYVTVEQPRKVSVFNVISALVQIAWTILFVAIWKQGAVGVLRAACVSSGLMAIVSVVLMLRMGTLSLSPSMLRPSLAYSLPLVPHLLANWALSVSDRLVLERYVSKDDVGRYSLGYMLSIAVSLVAVSAITPLTASANKKLGDPETAREIPPIGTLVLLATSVSALLACVCRRELIALLAPSAYREAAVIVPWVVLGSAFQGVYLVWSTGTWYSKKTTLTPFVTLTSVVVNIGLNLMFVPRYGVIAAAVSTAIAYAVTAALHGWLASKTHPVPWEYRRWMAMFAGALVAYFTVERLIVANVLLGIVVKSALALAAFAIVLTVVGFFSRSDLARALAFVRRRKP